jgi:hypothetical protein
MHIKQTLPDYCQLGDMIASTTVYIYIYIRMTTVDHAEEIHRPIVTLTMVRVL